jgi:hypothetical protein
MSSQLAGPIVVPYPPSPHPGSTGKYVQTSAPLTVNESNSPHDTEYVITNGKTFYIQEIYIRAGHNPSEMETQVEFIYYDGSAEHLFDLFFTGFPSDKQMYGDRGDALDETTMEGNGTTKKFIIRLTRLSSTEHKIYVRVEGYEQ